MVNSNKFLAILSRKAGRFNDHIPNTILHVFNQKNIPIEFHSFESGIEDLKKVTDQAIDDGYDNFLAVGGDGTVSILASCLYKQRHRLGIIPVGTTNTMARLLGIPLFVGKATQMAATSPKTRAIDGIEIGNRLFTMNVSTGISSQVIGSINPVQKSEFGFLSYLIGMIQMYRTTSANMYRVQVDNIQTNIRAVEIHITNTGVLGIPQYRINENSRIDDGEVEVLLIRGTSPWEFFSLLMDIIARRKKQIIKVIGKGKDITIESVKPLPVQADGDLIQQTPVTIRVLHRAISIIVP